jgi:hypothetical protein
MVVHLRIGAGARLEAEAIAELVGPPAHDDRLVGLETREICGDVVALAGEGGDVVALPRDVPIEAHGDVVDDAAHQQRSLVHPSG